jgi:hypothetical protein
VPASQADKAIEYIDYAQHCLKMAAQLPNRESRVILREMAAEWTNLAGQAAERPAPFGTQATKLKSIKARS